MTVYKIRNPEGLFSTGGRQPRWTETGHVFTSLTDLLQHLSFHGSAPYMEKLVVVEYEVTRVERAVKKIKEYFPP
jgi:hypothetical protein